MNAIDKPVEETPNEAVSETPPEVAAPCPEGSSADGYDVEFFRQMSDKLPSNLMVCDPETLNVTYVNETSRATLREIEDLLPAGVNADNIVG